MERIERELEALKRRLLSPAEMRAVHAVIDQRLMAIDAGWLEETARQMAAELRVPYRKTRATLRFRIGSRLNAGRHRFRALLEGLPPDAPLGDVRPDVVAETAEDFWEAICRAFSDEPLRP